MATSTIKATNTDYVVEQGTDGDWAYRKWASGIAECWGSKNWAIAGWTKWSNGESYYSNACDNYAYPTGLFNATPKLFVKARASTGDTWLGSPSYGGSDSVTPSYFLMRSTNGQSNITGYIDFYAIGKWQ